MPERFINVIVLYIFQLILCRSYVKQVISDLLQNKIDMSQLVITKALSKTG